MPTANEITRTECHDPSGDLRAYVGLHRDQPWDASVLSYGSSVSVGTGTDWIDITGKIGADHTMEMSGSGATWTFKGAGSSFDSRYFSEERRILIKARLSGGGTDSGWVDYFYGYLVAGGGITGDWKHNPYSLKAVGEWWYLDNTDAPSHELGTTNLAAGATCAMLTTLLTPATIFNLEHQTGGKCTPEMAVDAKGLATLACSANPPLPPEADSYFSPVNNRWVVINKVGGQPSGPNDTTPWFVSLIPSKAMHWTTGVGSYAAKNLGNIQSWSNTSSFMPTAKQIRGEQADPSDPPGLTGYHVNGNNWSLVSGQTLWDNSSGNVLRSSLAGTIPPHLLFRMSPSDMQSSDSVYTVVPGWKYKVMHRFKATLPNDGHQHFVRVSFGDAHTYQYVRLTGAWQYIEGEAVGYTGPGNPSLLDYGMMAWTTNDSSGIPDAAVTYLDTGRLQVVSGIPVKGEYYRDLQVGLGDLRLKMRDSTGTLLDDINLGSPGFSTDRAAGLQPIIVTNSKIRLEAIYKSMGNAIIVDIGEVSPQTWLDARHHAGGVINTLELYSAAITEVVRCDPGDPGCVNGQRTITDVAAVTHDIITLDYTNQPANTSYASYAGVYPAAPHGYRRVLGIIGPMTDDPYPHPEGVTDGSGYQTWMVTLPAFAACLLVDNISAIATQFAISGDLANCPMNAWIKIDSEFMWAASIETIGATNYLTVFQRGATVGGVPSTAASHSQGVSINPMIADDPPATTYHVQQWPRVVGVALVRKPNITVIERCEILYAKTAAALPTDRYSTGWTLLADVSGNHSPNITVLVPGNQVPPPPYPVDPTYWQAHQADLKGIEMQEVAVVVKAMSVRPDFPARDLMKLNTAEVWPLPVNQGFQGDYGAHDGIGVLSDLYGHFWCAHFGAAYGAPASQMHTRLVLDVAFRYVGIQFGSMSIAGGKSYGATFSEIANKAGLDWWVSEVGQLFVGFHRHSGLGVLGVAQYDFNRTAIRSITITQKPMHAVSQVKFSGQDRAGNQYDATFPPTPDITGKIETRTDMFVLSQDALNHQAHAEYNQQNSLYSVKMKVGNVSWLRRNMLVTVTWQFDNPVTNFDHELFVVASYRVAWKRKGASAYSVATEVDLEQRQQ